MGFEGKLSKKFFLNGITYFFLVILIEIFILKTTSYPKYTIKYQKFTKKNVKKRYYRLCSILAAYLRNPTCYYLSFVFPATLIWLLHCNAMHFDSFSLGARHLFQKLVLFFYVKLYL
jgi:hypothetical protein